MELMSLPAEILKAILVEAVACRTICRALRLRLVSRKFSGEVLEAISTAEHLDDCAIEIKDCPVAAFYIERRVLTERSSAYPEINHLRRIAQTLASEEPLSDARARDTLTRDYVVRLCTLIDQRLYLCRLFSTTDTRGLESRFQSDLLAAATAMDKEQLVIKLAGLVNNSSDRIFETDDAFAIAIKAGNHKMLDIFFEELENPLFRDIRRMGILVQAAKGGYLGTVNHVLESKWAPPSNSGTGYDNGVFHKSLKTPSIQIFETLLAAREKLQSKVGISEQQLKMLLNNSVYEGWIDMTRHLLSMGAPLDTVLGFAGQDNAFMIKACTAGYTDTVRLLLEHGAKVNEKVTIAAARHGHLELVKMLHAYGLLSDDAMSAAARGGHLSIVKWLLDTGKDVNASSPSPIVCAIEQEDTAMVQYLIERGATLNTSSTGGEAARRAKAAGLESMLALLREHGVELQDDESKDPKTGRSAIAKFSSIVCWPH